MSNHPGGAPPPPARFPYPPRPPRRGEAWSPGAFSPAIFLVALAVIGILVVAAVLSQRGRGNPATPVGGPATATAVPTAQPGAARTFIVANTGGEGVYLRRTPRLADRDTPYADGTRLVAIGADVAGEGQQWHHVRTPDGKTGYVPTIYTVEASR